MKKVKKSSTEAVEVDISNVITPGCVLTNPYQLFTEVEQLCFDLVTLVSSMTQRSLSLSWGGSAATPQLDGDTVILPAFLRDGNVKKSQEEVLLSSCKHELSHVLFKSDSDMMTAVAALLVTRVFGVPEDYTLQSRVFKLLNCLEDVRVDYLWQALYPGDGERRKESTGPLKQKWRSNLKDHMTEEGISSVFCFLLAVLLMDWEHCPSKKFDKYRSEVLKLKGDICLTTCEGMLKQSFSVLEKLLTEAREDWHKEQYSVKEEEEFLFDGTPHSSNSASTISKEGPFPLTQEEKNSSLLAPADYTLSDPPTDCGRGASIPRHLNPIQLMRYVEDTLEKVDVPTEEEAAINLLKTLQVKLEALSKKQKTSPVSFNYKEIVETTNEFQNLPFGLASEVRIWRLRLSQFYALRKTVLSEEGEALEVSAYLEQKYAQLPLHPYLEGQQGKGLELNVLLDLSGSMQESEASLNCIGNFLRQVFFRLPRTSLSLYGFTGRHDLHGEYMLQLTVFSEKGGELKHLPSKGLWGDTPLPQALEVLGHRLKTRAHRKHLIVVTDGRPMYPGAKEVSSSLVLEYTKMKVHQLREQKISVDALYLHPPGDASPKDEDEAAGQTIFGDRHWFTAPSNNFLPTLFRLLREKFKSFCG